MPTTKAKGLPIKGERRKRYATRVAKSGNRCSDVTVIHADGSKELLPAYTHQELQRVVKVRKVTSATRHKVFRRDHFTCRYCDTKVGPFEIDHVYPIALGGSNSIKNLVTACVSCNRDKGTNIWTPKPLRQS